MDFVRLIWKLIIIKLKCKKGDKRKNNYKTKYELFKWFVMLFSHTIAHDNLMILTTYILCAFIDSFVADYFDDIHSNNLC
jgi:hypothetical protein